MCRRVAFVLVLTAASLSSAQDRRQQAAAPVGLVQEEPGDDERFEAALRSAGLEPPPEFKALVGEVHLERDGVVTRWFEWQGTADDRDDWWPASTIKLYAAIAALEAVRARGFSPAVQLTFRYPEAPYRIGLSELVERAIVRSENPAFNRLVELVGFDEINRDFFTEEHGLGGTVFLRAYGAGAPHHDEETGHGINRFSPPVDLVEGDTRARLPPRRGRGHYRCPDLGNCTSLRELAEAMRRVMLHEHLPAGERYDLGDAELRLLRGALEAPRREHGRLLVEAVQRGFGDSVPLRVFHKPGYADRWTSEILFAHRTDTGQRFVVAAAARRNRRVLDLALEHIGRFLSSRRR